mmetsp:Transcript_3084/g.3321  ORF Transcript_3084/g.3321 Transcript_3084/m.3321 type:complete len:263 (-) Transcript_3084:991-1779(-)|eukprot:CAMPEP_0115023814 /NCGR_PEP_ID=MMETSP0216-20121206/32691_1 /TAXON_ID=223996 /ORGANISM="Protocruzia adherens, Strain Boccale" /LENGTH=262 /DNA_ID=CAMNT_0002397403 /DNA_START=171 /DNA_END=959 /DNA_ORIENTATION=+
MADSLDFSLDGDLESGSATLQVTSKRNRALSSIEHNVEYRKGFLLKAPKIRPSIPSFNPPPIKLPSALDNIEEAESSDSDEDEDEEFDYVLDDLTRPRRNSVPEGDYLAPISLETADKPRTLRKSYTMLDFTSLGELNLDADCNRDQKEAERLKVKEEPSKRRISKQLEVDHLQKAFESFQVSAHNLGNARKNSIETESDEDEDDDSKDDSPLGDSPFSLDGGFCLGGSAQKEVTETCDSNDIETPKPIFNFMKNRRMSNIF